MYCLVCNWKRYLCYQQLTIMVGTVYNIFDVKFLIFSNKNIYNKIKLLTNSGEHTLNVY